VLGQSKNPPPGATRSSAGGTEVILQGRLLIATHGQTNLKATRPITLTGSLVLYQNDPVIFEAAIRCFLDGSGGSLLFVVDNSEEPLSSPFFEHPRVRYHFAARNLGFGAGHNLALSLIEQHDGEPALGHLFLNPDVTFGPSVLPTLLNEMTLDPLIGAVMPQVLFSDGQLQRLCKLLPTPADLLLRRFLPVRPWVDALNRRYELFDLPQDGQQDVPSLSGCFLLVRSKLLKQVGGFDDRYFMYMEDVDLVRRIGDYGRTVYIPSVSITHGYGRGSYQNPKLLGYHLRSACIYFSKWGWWFDHARHARNSLTLNRLRAAQSANHRSPAAPRANAHLRIAVASGSGDTLTSHGTALLLALREAGCRPVIVGPQGDDTEQLISQGFDFIQLSTDTWPAHPLLALARVPSLRRVLKAGCFDAVFTFTGVSQLLFGAAARSLNLPHVPTVHHASVADGVPQRPQLRWLTDRMLRWARWVVLQGTSGDRKLTPGHQMNAQPVLRVPAMGVDLDQFAPAAWPDNSPNSVTPGPRYLFIVDTAQIQSVTPLIDAVRQLKTQVPGATVRWLGPTGSPSTGPMSQAQLDGWVAEGLLEYLGAPQDLRPATADADVVVLPSSGSGCLPAALLQACAMGRPCIAEDVPMCRAVVDHAVTGLLCDMRSVDSLAQTLLQFSALPLSGRQQLGQRARMKVEREFDLRAIAGTYTRVAEHLAVEARHRRAA
jgi:GT2 family glycosyltransferase